METEADDSDNVINEFAENVSAIINKRLDEEINDVKNTANCTISILVLCVLPVLASLSLFILIAFGTNGFRENQAFTLEDSKRWSIAWFIVSFLLIYMLSFPCILAYFTNASGFNSQYKKRSSISTKIPKIINKSPITKIKKSSIGKMITPTPTEDSRITLKQQEQQAVQSEIFCCLDAPNCWHYAEATSRTFISAITPEIGSELRRRRSIQK